VHNRLAPFAGAPCTVLCCYARVFKKARDVPPLCRCSITHSANSCAIVRHSFDLRMLAQSRVVTSLYPPCAPAVLRVAGRHNDRPRLACSAGHAGQEIRLHERRQDARPAVPQVNGPRRLLRGAIALGSIQGTRALIESIGCSVLGANLYGSNVFCFASTLRLHHVKGAANSAAFCLRTLDVVSRALKRKQWRNPASDPLRCRA